MTTKNIQDVVAEASEEIHSTFASAYAIGEKVNPDWLTTTLTQLVKEVEAGERDRIIKITTASRDAFMVPATKQRWLQALTPPTSDVTEK